MILLVLGGVLIGFSGGMLFGAKAEQEHWYAAAGITLVTVWSLGLVAATFGLARALS